MKGLPWDVQSPWRERTGVADSTSSERTLYLSGNTSHDTEPVFFLHFRQEVTKVSIITEKYHKNDTS